MKCEGCDKPSMNMDLFGFYWPLKNQQTIVGATYNVWGEGGLVIGGQWSASTMHFIQSSIGEGPFLRADVGYGFFIAVYDDNDEIFEGMEKSGLSILYGLGYALPVGAGGTRILFNVNVARRPGIDGKEEYWDGWNWRNKTITGSVKSLNITVGALF